MKPSQFPIVRYLFLALLLGASTTARATRPLCNGQTELRALTPKPHRISRPTVDGFRTENSVFNEVTTRDNRSFMDSKQRNPHKESICLYSGSANLRDLNTTIIGDKSLVDSIENYDKKLLFKKIQSEPMVAKLASEKKTYERFNDYSAIEFEFEKGGTEYNQTLDNRLITHSQQTAIEFENTIEALPIRHSYRELPGISAQPRTWRETGIGSNPREARIAAKYSAMMNQNLPWDAAPHVAIFRDIEPHLEKMLLHLDEIEGRLAHARELTTSEFLVKVPTTDKRWRLSEQAMDYLAKSHSRDEFKDLILANFKVKLTEPQLDDVMNWYQTAEGFFSPKVYEAERKSVHGMESPFGATWLDYRGLSSRKIAVTLDGLAQTRGQGVKAALNKIDELFTLDHARLLKQHEKIESLARESFGSAALLASGDDAVILSKVQLTLQQKRKFVRLVSQDPETNQIRTVFAHFKVPSLRGSFIRDAESLEKTARLNLVRKIDKKTLKNLNFAMNLSEDAQGAITFEPLIAGPLSPHEKDEIRAIFELLKTQSIQIKPVVFLN